MITKVIEEALSYRGKHFTVPEFSTEKTLHYTGDAANNAVAKSDKHLILRDLNTVWDLEKFKEEGRKPISLGCLNTAGQALFSMRGLPRVLDMPIKFPGSEFRVPGVLAQLGSVIQRVADFEAVCNSCYDEYYCYLTVDQAPVKKGRLQREAPCHVDGFQGANWTPKVKINHSYVISDCVPTTYYPQYFSFDGLALGKDKSLTVSKLDETKHNFFWEMNRQVAATNSKHAWQPEPYEINMIDAYTVHRGSPAPEDMVRTWVRLSFEVRIFNRLGNAHNPLFKYDWKMERRDIEGLNLIPFDPNCDPTLRVFPWQKPDGTTYEDPKMKTQPNLYPEKGNKFNIFDLDI